jgi:hypothetical protein
LGDRQKTHLKSDGENSGDVPEMKAPVKSVTAYLKECDCINLKRDRSAS